MGNIHNFMGNNRKLKWKYIFLISGWALHCLGCHWCLWWNAFWACFKFQFCCIGNSSLWILFKFYFKFIYCIEILYVLNEASYLYESVTNGIRWQIITGYNGRVIRSQSRGCNSEYITRFNRLVIREYCGRRIIKHSCKISVHY